MFSELIVGYLFLAGSGSGLCSVLAIMGLFVPRPMLAAPAAPMLGGIPNRSLVRSGSAAVVPPVYRALFVPPYVVALVLLIVGMVCLMADLGHVDRLVLLVTRPRLSYITVGAYALALCALLALVVLAAWRSFIVLHYVALRALQVALALASLVVMAYTGLFLSSMRAVPLWSTVWLPVLFVFSSVSCGIAVVMITSTVSRIGERFARLMARLVRTDAVVIGLEAAVLIALGFVLFGSLEALFAPAPQSPSASLAGLQNLTNTDIALLESFWSIAFGSYSLIFWVALVFMGLALPFAFDLAYTRMRKPHRVLAIVSSVGVLVGGYALRHCVVAAGIHPALIMTGVM